MNDKNGVSVQPIHGFRQDKTTVGITHQLLLTLSEIEKNILKLYAQIMTNLQGAALETKVPRKVNYLFSNGF